MPARTRAIVIVKPPRSRDLRSRLRAQLRGTVIALLMGIAGSMWIFAAPNLRAPYIGASKLTVAAVRHAKVAQTVAYPGFAKSSLTAPVTIVSPTVTPLPPTAAFAEPFGIEAVPVSSGNLELTWSRLERDIHAERSILAQCRADIGHCSPAAQKLLAIIVEARAHTGRARLGLINRAVNLAIRPLQSPDQQGMHGDDWHDPLTTLSTGRGDCKDYATAKYAALLEAGVAQQNVSLVILRDLAASENHAVVAVRLDGSWIVLDSRWFALVADIKMRRVIPLFVLNETGVKRNNRQNLEPAFPQLAS
jgi:predicted transglutaminase-like cysteine proteinase